MSTVICPRMFLKKEIQIPRRVIKDLKEVSAISCRARWEYAGHVKTFKMMRGDHFVFGKSTRVTSKDRSSVDLDTVINVWPSLVSYHTHPCVTVPSPIKHDTTIFVTLPSNCDFEAYIKGYPEMQVNIICDTHGYYIVDLISAAERGYLPFPRVVNIAMNDFRKRKDIQDMYFSEEGLEYFSTDLNTWKNIINHELGAVLNDLFGITIRYFGYDDESPIVSLDLDSI